jgi:3-dehydroquinate dehydratase/shikimate dehydrogenase
MICVSIGRGRHKHVIAENRHLVEQGARLVELRLDYINGVVNLKRLLSMKPCPVVITCRREQDGGKWSGTEAERKMLLRGAIAEGVDYVDLEEDVAAEIPRFGSTKRIISTHDFQNTPEDLPALIERLAALDADIVKIASMANRPRDNVRMLQAVKQANVPVVGFCMGEIGTPSRILAGKYGAPFSFATFHHERTLAPGQLTYNQMNDIYRYDDINEETDVYGVVADPIGHSMSPLIHNRAFQHTQLNKVYVPLRVPREDLADFLDDCPKLGIKGLSVTIPHKEAVIPKLNRVDGAVRGIGACNTIVFDNGDLIGYNTDYRAAMDCLDALLPGFGESSGPLEGQTALVLGSGGVARAIAFGLVRRKADLVIAGVETEQAERLASTLGGRTVPWDDRHLIRPRVLVNCTPVGMHPNVDETPFDGKYLRSSMIVFDAVYNPEQTLLIKQARDKNCRTITGVAMFIGQAALQFKHFTGEDPPIELMREVLKEATGAVRN